MWCVLLYYVYKPSQCAQTGLIPSLRSTDIKALHKFTWDQLLTKLRENAPVFLRLLYNYMYLQLPKHDYFKGTGLPQVHGDVGVWASIFLKQKMRLGHKIMSL